MPKRFILHENIVNFSKLENGQIIWSKNTKKNSTTHFLSSSCDNTINIWEIKSELSIADSTKVLNRFQLENKSIRFLTINDHNPLKKQIITGGQTLINIWNLNTHWQMNHFRTLRGHTGSIICAIVDTNEQLITGSSDGTIKKWNTLSSQCLLTFLGHENRVNDLILHETNKLISASSDKSIRIWNLTTATCLNSLLEHTSIVLRLLLLNNNSSKLISCSNDRTIKIWNLNELKCEQTLIGHRFSIDCMLITPDLVNLVTGSCDSNICVWNLKTYELEATLCGHTGPVWILTYLSSTCLLVSGSSDGFVRLWDMRFKRFSCLKVINFYSSVNCLTLVSDKWLMVGLDNGEIHKINLMNGLVRHGFLNTTKMRHLEAITHLVEI